MKILVKADNKTEEFEGKNFRTDAETDLMINAMYDSMDSQEDPQVGIFWYDVVNDELFGVVSEPAEDAKEYISEFGSHTRTGKRLHKDIWKKEYFKGKDKRFQGDYTKIPRGRVFQIDDKFVVMVGDWVDEYPQVKDEVLYEFQLPKNTEFRKDIHWNIGHGWSEELI